MATRPPLHTLSPRSPAAATQAFPPSTVPARPHSARPPSPSPLSPSRSPFPPRRPHSASCVRATPTTSSNAAVRLRAQPTDESPRQRPASASRVRVTSTTSSEAATSMKDRRRHGGRLSDAEEDDDVDTILIPTSRIQITQPELNDSDRPDQQSHPVMESSSVSQQDTRLPLDLSTIAQAEQFLLNWQCEESSFRSPLLYAESSFAQVKAMTAREWPHPNVFLSSVAFGCLELFCQSLEHRHPFLLELLDVLGMGLFTNYSELRRKATAMGVVPSGTSRTSNFLHYMQHGQYCFQQLHAHEEQLSVWRSAAQKATKEAARLTEQIQKQHVTRLYDRVQSRVRVAAMEAAASDSSAVSGPATRTATGKYPYLRRVLYGDKRGAHLDLQVHDYEFEPNCDEVLLFFSSLPSSEALRLLDMLQTKAAEMQLSGIGEQFALAVDILSENERSEFLTYYFQLISSEELQEALRLRDESNQDKMWQAFLNEMKDVLRVDESTPVKEDVIAQSKLHSFHSDEARLGARIYDLVDLLEEIAAEVSLADDKKPLRLSEEVINRLKPFHSGKKRVEKARQLMMTKPETIQPPEEPSATCICVCGHHRLVSLDQAEVLERSSRSTHEDADAPPPEADSAPENPVKIMRPSSAHRRSTSGQSTLKRKGSTAVRGGSRVSLVSVRIFSLAEACHLVSSVVQLQFSRDALDGPSGRRGSTRRDNSRGPGQAPRSDQRPSFKALAKDLLVRKYGIKSIAVMHLLQLEKSLIHYGTTDKHARCELFAWFIGADKTRAFSKDFAYQFYLRLIKTIMAILLKKPANTLTYADQIAVWTEQIGEADTSAVGGAVSPMFLSVWQSVEVCNLAFPSWMKESSAYANYVGGINSETGMVELEPFIKCTMDAWETQFVALHAQVEKAFTEVMAPTPVEELDVTLFNKGIRANGLEMTSGEMLEHFDVLSSDEDAYLPLKKAVLFVMERKVM